jgi:uncharacterized protein (TIGR04551 family)
MISVSARFLPPFLAGALALAVAGGTAHAQAGPGPFPSSPTGGQEDPKKEGVAEAAPKTAGALPTTPALPAPKSRRKKLELFELDGYFRLRTEWFKNFHLGFNDNAIGGAPFARNPGCGSDDDTQPCKGTLSSTNMRLRLEPTINIDENASVHLQIDVLDNLVLGSTPDGDNIPDSPAADPATAGSLGAFSDGQQSPQAGINDTRDAIRVKRAWGELSTPLGVLKFGRMPDAFGMGMVHNSGSEDPFSGGYDRDSEFGDSVDRVIFSTLIPNTRIRAAVGYDWPMSGLSSSSPHTVTTNNIDRKLGLDYVSGGQPYDLDDADDVTQWVFVVSRLDSPTDFRDALDRGELALNYGGYVGYRTQSHDRFQLESDVERPFTAQTRIDYKAYVPNAWVKLAWGGLQLEAEIAAVIGSMLHPVDRRELDLRQFGGIARLSYRAVEDKLNVGVEGGFASGDQYDTTPEGRIHIRNRAVLPTGEDDDMTQFLFDREYKVDMILFRELIGAVTNAIYVKPYISYQLTDTLVMRGSLITSFAHRPVATPGNKSPLGLEFNGDFGYEGRAFFTGISYGLLLPLSGLEHGGEPGENQDRNALGFGAGNVGDAGNAHAIQARFVLRF